MDIMSKSQLSTILRYVTNEGVEERFLGFVDVSHDRSVKCLAEHFLRLLYEHKCIDKIIFDVTYCNKKIFDFLNHVKNMKNDFDRIWLKSEQYHTDLPLRSKRQRVTEVSIDRKTNYRRLYIEIIDVLISKTNERFSEITQLTFFLY